MKFTEKLYGQAPKDMGAFNLKGNVEMLFYLYLPIKNIHSWGGPQLSGYHNLNRFMPLVNAVRADMTGEQWFNNYIYLTAKVMPISPENPGNRPGWHCDGFMSEDVNYVWADCSPTYFLELEKLTSFVQDHTASLSEMTGLASLVPERVRAYPNNHLLRMDQYVIHRVGDPEENMLRSFCKISVSKNRYDLEGNSRSDISQGWDFKKRAAVRNHPSTAQSDSSMA